MYEVISAARRPATGGVMCCVSVCVARCSPGGTRVPLFLRYGIFERCRELVEAGFDVRQPDKENVTLLHWAAINNRIDLVK